MGETFHCKGCFKHKNVCVLSPHCKPGQFFCNSCVDMMIKRQSEQGQCEINARNKQSSKRLKEDPEAYIKGVKGDS